MVPLSILALLVGIGLFFFWRKRICVFHSYRDAHGMPIPDMCVGCYGKRSYYCSKCGREQVVDWGY